MEKNRMLLIVTMLFIIILLGIILFKINQKQMPTPYLSTKVVITI